MIPQRRLATLLDQAAMHQQNRCLYHNTPVNWRTWSLYADHRCDKDGFPRVTTAILDAHSDEVWNLQWSHNGEYLASAGKDQTAIIWRVGVRFIFSSGYNTRSAHRISFPLVFFFFSDRERSFKARVLNCTYFTRSPICSRLCGVVTR